MEILSFLKDYPILDVIVILGVIGIVSRIRSQFLDVLLTNFKRKWIKFLILAGLSFSLSTGFTALINILDFNFIIWVKSSILNFAGSYILYDVVKKIFIKGDDEDD
jgi:hypothetical protein